MSHPAFKLMIVGRRRAGTTLAQHHDHIRQVHGAMVAEYIARDPEHAPQRYVQNRVLDGSFRPTSPANDPFALHRDFVTQIWFGDAAHAAESVRQPYYLQHLRPDEDRFVDQASVVKLAVREQFVMPPGQGAHIKLFAFFRKSPAIGGDSFLKTWRGCSGAAAMAATGIRLCGHAQNEVLNRPGDVALVDAVDEFWLEDLASAHALATLLSLAILAPLQASGAADSESHFMLMAEEAVLYKGSTP